MTNAASSPSVLIVGGGPAGLAAAIALRMRGAAVTVADARRPPIDKACGEGMMPDSRAELARLGIELTSSDEDTADGFECRGIRFVHHSQAVKPQEAEWPGDVATAQFHIGEEQGIGLRRVKLHQRLAQRAEEIGVTLLWETPARLEPDGGVRVDGQLMPHDWLIGADGQASQVRRWAGLDAGTTYSSRYGFRRHFEIEPWSPYIELHWGPKGQANVTPVGPNAISISTMGSDAQARLDGVLEAMPRLAEKIRGKKPLDAERGSITTTRRLLRVAKGRVALVGDASGSADSVTGEGLAISFRHALLLAESLDKGNLEHYNRAHAKIMQMPQGMARLMLLLDRFAPIRKRALRMLAADPSLFTGMLDVHLGKQSLPGFVASKGLEIAWRMVTPPGEKAVQS